MTAHALIALAGATALFAFIPGPGIMAVVAQAVARGFVPAVLWCAGQVVGDMVYLLAALFGLGYLAGQLGDGFVVLRLLGAGYLVYLGVRCWLARPPAPGQAPAAARGAWRSLVGGMCVSLGNPKAIAFYCGFLPAFLDMGSLGAADVAVVVAVMCPIVFLVPVGYAWLASRGGRLLRSTRVWKAANRTAGAVMIGTGVAVATD